MQQRSTSEDDPHRADLVILGSGAGGLTAALTASLNGLHPIVLDHSGRIGGTSARSSGTVWVPDNHHLRVAGVRGDGEAASRYLASLVGERGEPAMWRAFLDNAPPMLADLEARAGLCFRPYMSAPDYRQEARRRGRWRDEWAPARWPGRRRNGTAAFADLPSGRGVKARADLAA